jgi:DNA transposition AAA+ family ATPase
MERDEQLECIRQRDEEHEAELFAKHDWLSEPFPKLQPTYGEVSREYGIQNTRIADPTTLILIDEVDRLRMASLEQVRAIFDASEVGIVLIGVPGLEKRLARYAQFYSRIGFVHEFRPLGTTEIRRLLSQPWTPAGVNLPEQPWVEEAIAAIIRITGGNFRLLYRLLTQMERILEINSLREINKAVVNAARESLVIGQA